MSGNVDVVCVLSGLELHILGFGNVESENENFGNFECLNVIFSDIL